ncbi:MAG: hypothetical protein LBJ63_04885 [Prevotellaceae bacterium]|jgi:hypothetical protein|nr:hypothetical protein [Prevotellaceae bacterium]
MKCLIEANEVLELAFTQYDHIDDEAILETKIRAAEDKFIRPVLNGVYFAMLEGRHAVFCNEFIKPALAYFVKYSVIPDLSVKIGNNGAQTAYTQFSDAATDKQREILRAQALDDGNQHLNIAVRYVEEHIRDFPEYKKIKNEQKHTSILGGIILGQ